MTPSHSSPGDDRVGPESGPREPTIAELYAEHWPYVLDLLPSYGIAEQDAEDVAQLVWLHAFRRRRSYDPAKHKTRRAWITGFVQRCAANHRRTRKRRGLIPVADPGQQLAASGVNPEEAAILRDLHRMIPNDEHRVALLLQVRHGLSIAEIAAVQEVSESTVGWRLSMARRALAGDDKKKSRAFLGFGSLEALAKALKPRPHEPEVGERLWQKIAESIQQEEASPRDADPPPSSYPPAAALPAPASPTGPLLGALSRAKVGIVVLFAFVGGSGALVWRAHDAKGQDSTASALDATTVASASPSSVGPAVSSASVTTAATSTAATVVIAAPSTSARSAASCVASSTSVASTAVPSTSESQRLLARMREAMRAHQLSTVLALAEEHAQRFGATNVREREALRIEALRRTGQSKRAEQHARAVLAAYPEHRGAMERAAGQPLP